MRILCLWLALLPNPSFAEEPVFDPKAYREAERTRNYEILSRICFYDAAR
jgi:hypothetical protein